MAVKVAHQTRSAWGRLPWAHITIIHYLWWERERGEREWLWEI